jgi:hypothetical protein
MFNGSLAVLTGASFFRFGSPSTSHSRSAPQLTLVAPPAKSVTPKSTIIKPSRSKTVMEPPTTCKQRPPPRLYLSASLVFSAKELRQYLRFRRATTLRLPTSELDRIPTAAEYADYVAWKEKQRTRESLTDLFNPYDSFGDLSAHLGPVKETHSESYEPAMSFATATKCGHVLHPGTPYPHTSATKQLNIERCPACTIAMHLTYMALLNKALNASGGPVRPREAPDSKHEAVFQAWNVGKLNLVQTVYQYEEYTKHEEDFRRCMYMDLSAWERKSAEESLQNVQGAKEALELYYEEELELRSGMEVKVTQQKMTKKKQNFPKCGKRRVGFREDTCFEPSRCHAYFCRKSPRFDGKYLQQGIYEDDSDTDIEIPTIIDDNAEPDCSDMAENPLERYPDPEVVQEDQTGADKGVGFDILNSTLNVSFESSTSNSDTTVRGSSSEPDSASESDTDVEDMEVEEGASSIPFQCESEDDESSDEEDGSEEDEDSSDEEGSGSGEDWDGDDDEGIGGDFIVFG